MAQTIREVMSDAPIAMPDSAPLTDAAKRMKEAGIGDVIVLSDNQVCGIVTDRDIVIRAVAEGRNPADVQLKEICSKDLVSVTPDESVDRVVEVMRERAIRRIPVVEEGRPVGIVTIGDLAIELDPKSVLADISEERPTQ